MSTYNGEPYPGFFKEMEEKSAQMEPGLPADSIIAWDDLTGELNVQASWIEACDERITALEDRVAKLEDMLKRTEAFTNSMMRNRTIEMEVVKTPINIPARKVV